MADTFLYFKKLEQAGFTRKQAEAQVEMVTDYYSHTSATKVDLMQLRTELSKEIQIVEAKLSKEIQGVDTRLSKEIQAVRDDIRDIRHDMKSLGDRLTIRLGGMMIIGFGALAALIKLT